MTELNHDHDVTHLDLFRLLEEKGFSEAYEELWRSKKIPAIVQNASDPFLESVKDLYQHSRVYKAFRAELEFDRAFCEKSIKDYKKTQEPGSCAGLSQELSIKHFSELPGYRKDMSLMKFKSNFTKSEMNHLYNIFLKLLKDPCCFMEFCTIFRERVMDEQGKYLEHSRRTWELSGFKRHMEILPEVTQFINGVWEFRLQTVLKYPRFYSLVEQFNLVNHSSHSVEMTFVQDLKRFGHVKKIYFPNTMKKRVNIFEEIGRLKIQEERRRKKVESLDKFGKYSLLVSRDAIAEHIAITYKADVVLSSSAFKRLVDNHLPSFNSTWDLPISVKECSKERIGSKKVVFIDKALPPRSLNNMERNKWFYKIGCDFALRVESERYGITQEMRSNDLMPEPLEENDFNDEDSELVVDEVEEAPEKREDETTAIRPLGLTSTKYRLWRLKASTSTENALRKGAEPREISLVIRTKESHLLTKAKKQFWISPKLEYQTEFGAEAVTLSEVTREWASCFIRPNAELARVRVDTTKGDIVMVDKKSVSEISKECFRLHNIKVSDQLRSLYAVLDKLVGLSPGNYLLSHKPTNGAFAPIFKESTLPSEYSLRTSYVLNVDDVAPERSPWSPIDTMALTPTFRTWHRIPATFPPKGKVAHSDLAAKEKKEALVKKKVMGKKAIKRKKANVKKQCVI